MTMSATSCLLSEEQFLCCICLDVFTKPVTIPCGHNFCKNCITQHWNVNRLYQCPLCKKHFKTEPELLVNTFISEMTAEFKQSAVKQRRGSVAQPGEVPCDICTETTLKAVKSCLTCIASYCEVHLDPHMTSEPLKKHLLVEPVKNIADRVCVNHKKPLELFCKTDQTCVCSLCAVLEHAAHKVVPLEDEYKVKSAELQQVEAEMLQRIQEKQMRILRIKSLKKHSKDDAEREVAGGIQIFNSLIETAQRGLNELIEVIEEGQKTAEDQADGLIGELEKDISAMNTATAEIHKFTQTQDHVHFLQNFTPMNGALCAEDRAEVSVHLPSYDGTLEKAVDVVEETFTRQKQLLLHKARLRRVHHYASDVTLEPHTANPWLILSDDGKQVRCGEVRRDLPDNNERFSLYAMVLAQQSFSHGRFYYEVQVTGKTDWTLGVVKRSINRKEIIPLSPENGYWAVGLRNGNEYLSLASPAVSLRLNSEPQRVGVFVSYEEGLVSFHDTDCAVDLYSFTNCCFTEEICPFFSPGLHHGGVNAAPLIILPVDQTD